MGDVAAQLDPASVELHRASLVALGRCDTLDALLGWVREFGAAAFAQTGDESPDELSRFSRPDSVEEEWDMAYSAALRSEVPIFHVFVAGPGGRKVVGGRNPPAVYRVTFRAALPEVPLLVTC